jgi:hypothetical protein
MHVYKKSGPDETARIVRRVESLLLDSASIKRAQYSIRHRLHDVFY